MAIETRICFLFTLLVVITMFLLSSCAGSQAALSETWTLVELTTQGERTDTVTEIIEVRNCGFVERKTTECSAGTMNDMVVSLSGGLYAGEGVAVSLGAGVSTGLGFGRNSGESLDLDSPPDGIVYRYTVNKDYHVLAGKGLARSTGGIEQEASYAYHASCSISIESREEFSCSTELYPKPVESHNEPSADPMETTVPISNDQWNGLLSVRMPTLNEIRAENPPSLWDANLVTVKDMDSPGIDEYEGKAQGGQEYLFPVYWCTTSSDLLEQNMDHIQTSFLVNGEIVPEKYIFTFNYDTDNGWKCTYHSVVLSDWVVNNQYFIDAKRTLSTALSDGKSRYPAGDYVYRLKVTVRP